MGFEDTEPEIVNTLAKKVYVICEGEKTEPNYLELFQRAHRDDGSFSITNIEKKSFDTHNSNRKDMMNLLDGEMVRLSMGKNTPFFLITLILRNFSELIGLDDRIKKDINERKNDLYGQLRKIVEGIGILHGDIIGYNENDFDWFLSLAEEYIEKQDKMIDPVRLKQEIKAIWFKKEKTTKDVFGKIVHCYAELYELDDPESLYKKLWKIRRELIEDNPEIKYLVDNGNIISDEKSLIRIVIEKIKTDMRRYYKDEYYDKLSFSESYYCKPKGMPDATDRKFIVFDRDFDDNADEGKKIKEEERTDEDYLEIIDFCNDKDRNYEVLLSTPFFELWLLMHHSDADYRGIKRTTRKPIESQIIRLEKIPTDDKKKLKKALKNIGPNRFNDYYKDTFQSAVEVSESDMFTTDPRELITNIGTNVGVKLKSLLDD